MHCYHHCILRKFYGFSVWCVLSKLTVKPLMANPLTLNDERK